MYQFDPTNNLPAGVSHAAIERAMDGGWYMEEEVEEEGCFDVFDIPSNRAWKEDILARLEEELGREPTKEEFEEEFEEEKKRRRY